MRDEIWPHENRRVPKKYQKWIVVCLLGALVCLTQACASVPKTDIAGLTQPTVHGEYVVDSITDNADGTSSETYVTKSPAAVEAGLQHHVIDKLAEIEASQRPPVVVVLQNAPIANGVGVTSYNNGYPVVNVDNNSARTTSSGGRIIRRIPSRKVQSPPPVNTGGTTCAYGNRC